MNIQLNLSLDTVNSALVALTQLQTNSQNALEQIKSQAQAQVNPVVEAAPEVTVVDVTDQKVGGTD